MSITPSFDFDDRSAWQCSHIAAHKGLQTNSGCATVRNQAFIPERYNDCAFPPHLAHPCVLAVCVVCHTCLIDGLLHDLTKSVMFLFCADCLLSPVGFHVLHDSSVDATVLEQGG